MYGQKMLEKYEQREGYAHFDVNFDAQNLINKITY